MRGELAWRCHMAARLRLRKLAPEHLLDLLARKRAKAKQGDVVAVDAEHRRLESERARTAIEDHGRNIVKLRLHMGRSGRTDAPRTVGARRGDGQLHRFQQGTRNRMVRGAERNGVETGADEIGNGAASRARQHQRQWSRPEGADQFPRSVVDGGVALRLLKPEHMHDQRIEAGAVLGGKHLGDAEASSALAPSPYTVSVGKATISPRAKASAARLMDSFVAARIGMVNEQGLVQFAYLFHFAC